MQEGIEIARAALAQRFPRARAAWLGGSVAAGTARAGSDLDITVLLDGPPAPMRCSEMTAGWPVEFFVHTEQSLRRFSRLDRARRRPTTLRLIGSSVVSIDADGTGHRLRREFADADRAGPGPAAADDLDAMRYALTDVLSDLRAGGPEAPWVGADAVRAAGDLLLATHGRWSGSGKWLWRELAAFDAERAGALSAGLHAVAAGDPRPLAEAIGAVLDECGGQLFAGFHRSGSIGDPAGALRITPLRAVDAEDIARWRYEGRRAVYDIGSPAPILDHLAWYHGVRREGRLIGFCCTGAAAGVRGLPADPGAVDVGVGLSPELLDRGLGVDLGRAVLAFLDGRHPDGDRRAVVQSWNAVSLGLAHRLGFVDAGSHTTSDDPPVAYRVLRLAGAGSAVTSGSSE